MQATTLSPWTPQAWGRRLPAHLVNGVSVGLGMACITTWVALAADLPTALIASSGAAVVSIADTITPPQAKTRPMWMAAIASLLVAVIVAFCHANVVAMGMAVMSITFSAILWTAWGKRGGPLTFAMILAMVFQMAAFDHSPLNGLARWAHLGWVALGALSMVGWAIASTRLLAPRYQTLAVADSLRALSRLIDAQADWLLTLPSRVQAAQAAQIAHAIHHDRALLPLVRQQAAIAEVFQQTRDLLYSQTGHAHAQRWIPGFIGIVDVRDLVLACQLDLDNWPAGMPMPDALLSWGHEFKSMADRMARMADSIAWGTPWPDMPAATMVAADSPASTDQAQLAATLLSLQRRHAHLHRGVQRLADALASPDQSTPIDEAVLHAMRSPVDWPLANLRASLNRQSPVLRHAARATAAMACAYLLAHATPWASHPQWLLMTVAVVMRGNLEQTLARRNARVVGTVMGCLIASGLLALHPSGWLVLAVVALALSLAHAYALVDYRITSMAGAVLALLQSHAAQGHLLPVAAVERLGDTLVGAGLAWGFSYLWPAWERHQLPRLVARLLQAQARYAHHVLGQGVQSTLGVRGSHARREVYDVVWLLTQSLQRMHKEPASQRTALQALEAVLVRSHRLTSQIAGIRGLLLARQAEFDPALTLAVLKQADARMLAHLGSTPMPMQSPAPISSPPNDFTHADTAFPHEDAHDDASAPILSSEQPGAIGSPLPWLARRLHHAEADAQALGQATRAFLACTAQPS